MENKRVKSLQHQDDQPEKKYASRIKYQSPNSTNLSNSITKKYDPESKKKSAENIGKRRSDMNPMASEDFKTNQPKPGDLRSEQIPSNEAVSKEKDTEEIKYNPGLVAGELEEHSVRSQSNKVREAPKKENKTIQRKKIQKSILLKPETEWL